MGEASFATLLIQSIGALALVLAMFAGLVWFFRKFQLPVKAGVAGRMQVVQRLHLDGKNSVVEIAYGDQHFLLGVGQGGIHKIADIEQSTIKTTIPEKVEQSDV
ncbi:MAG: hypothetical protein AUK35_01160 [Zetaproteobacteria bacterium CG2_30_46_52]|nr:MAG: hypothetical protein AUK35_01160 [Zetaproteobacteria bacterium CG2_30_46_52]